MDLVPPSSRDFVGYGERPPHARWPGAARIALQFVINYEEGAEASVQDGDAGSEVFLSEIVSARAYAARHMSMESLYEYGARAGVWRLLRCLRGYRVPATVFAVALALERNPRVAQAFLEDGHEVASHGWRWISYQQIGEEVEREHMARAVESLRRLTGQSPEGWYTGRDSPNTRRLLVEHGGFSYSADSYADDLPYWTAVDAHDARTPLLIVPYTLDSNDMRFATAQGFNSGEQFYTYLKDAFDVLYAEGDPAGLDAPKMLSIGLHCRLAGRPGRVAALSRFIAYARRHEDVWFARRIDIARHWEQMHPWRTAA
ncbi:MAG TPA: allantoinase PuuE [Casimicrobiaceae bacterium]